MKTAANKTSAAIQLKPASLALLLALIEDSGNWSNSPMVDISNEERGNLTDLKRKKLLRTFSSDGVEFTVFLFSQVQVTDGTATWELTSREEHSTAEIVNATPAKSVKADPKGYMAWVRSFKKGGAK